MLKQYCTGVMNNHKKFAKVGSIYWSKLVEILLEKQLVTLGKFPRYFYNMYELPYGSDHYVRTIDL